MKRILTHSVLFLTLALLVFHLFSKDFSNPYERPIAGDAQAYYAYLPAIFIYQDLDYEFIDSINEKYYPESYQKSFLKASGDGKVNKTFPGVALLYLPFFLIAHALALLFGLEADGYSTVYQVLFDLGLWVYLFFGLMGLKKVLQLNQFSTLISNLVPAILLLGTNLFFYSVYDQSVTHVYNFFMINGFIYLLLKHKENQQLKPLLYAAFLISLIGITRPTNILVVGLVLFFITDFQFYKNLFRYLFKPRNVLPITTIAGCVLIIPFILWKLQTGNWIVYSYGEEGFNFDDPHLFEFIFSYLKGWWVYTPLAALIIIIGLPILYQRCKKKFIIAIGFYFITIYVFSSWWCWYYGAGMSQRVMIDHYILLGYLLAIILQKTNISNCVWSLKQTTFGLLVALFVFVNIVQAWQIRHGILTGGSATSTQYWDNFLVFEKQARVYPHEHWKLEAEKQIDLNPSADFIKKGTPLLIENHWSIEVTAWQNYSASVYLPVKNLRQGSKLILHFDSRARTESEETRLVIELDGQRFVFGLDQYLKKDEWVEMEFMIEPTQEIKTTPFMFFWNGGSEEKAEFKDIQVNHFFTESYL